MDYLYIKMIETIDYVYFFCDVIYFKLTVFYS